MKDYRRLRLYFMCIALVATLAACAGNANRESTGEYVDDSALTTKVKTAIYNDPMLEVLEIKVDTFKGVVELHGVVESEKVSAQAEKVANSVRGVKSVQNDLVVR
ncbi:MAG: BON domain-containing protein [Desulfovibrionaceae bacterium]|nr:BON domain-containing protein [Desulfovibrionaceae bacterium]MBF0515349.1 BON domain-containing protein [Desulfovibrionaceae bacterium]